MRNPLSDKIVSIQPSGIRKFFDIVSEMKDAISLGVGEPDFDTPWHIRDEGIYSLEKGRTFYTSNAGLKELKIEICNYLKRRFDVEYDYNKEVMVTVGGSEAIDIALRAMLNPGDEVLIPQPSYVSYTPCTVLADGVPVTIQLEEKDKFRLTKEKLLEKITPKTKVLILPFPNNPTGSIMEPEDLAEIAKICIEKDLFVISDEIYSELTYKGQHCTIAAFPGMKERTVLINGFSKAFAMTGWRLGYLACNTTMYQVVLKLFQHSISCTSGFLQRGALTAMDCVEETEQMRQAYEKRKNLLVKGIHEIPGVELLTPAGAFYAWVKFDTDMDSETLCNDLLDKAKIAGVPGIAYGEEDCVCIRFSFAASEDVLRTMLERLKTYQTTHNDL